MVGSKLLRAWLALVLVLALPWSGVAFAKPAPSSASVRAASVSATEYSDDELPGIPMGQTAVYEMLDMFDVVDIYSVYLHEGDTLGLALDTDLTLQASVSLLGPDPISLEDLVVASAGPGEIFSDYTVPAGSSGLYSVVVANVAGEGGYLLTPSWTMGGPLDNPDWASNVPGSDLPGGRVSGTVAPDDRDDVFILDLLAGQTVNVNWMTGPGSDLQLYLYEPGTEDVNYDDFLGPVYAGSSMSIRATQSGRYYLDVWAPTDSPGGPYTLDINVVDPLVGEVPDAPAEAPGLEAPASPFNGGFDTAGDDWGDTWAVWAEEGQEISVLASSTSDGLEMTLDEYDPEAGANTLEWSTSQGYGRDILSLEAPYSGWFHIRLNASEQCEYELSYDIAFTDNFLPGLPGSSPVAGAVDWSNDRRDYVTANLTAGDLVTVTLESSAALDADLVVYPPDAEDPDWYLTKSDGAGASDSITFQPEYSGAYTFLVKAAAGAGNYRLTWSAAPAAADDDVAGVPLGFGNPVNGTTTSLTDSTDVYRVSLEAGRKYRFTTTGSAFSPGLMLFGPGTDTVWGESAYPLTQSWIDERTNFLSFIAEESGEHYLVVKSNETQSYSLKAIDAGVAEANDVPETAPALGLGVMTALTENSNWVDWYKISANEGENVTVKLTKPGGADIFVTAYQPGDLQDGYYGEGTGNVSRVRFTAPETGTYYVKVETLDGSGDYQLEYGTAATGEDDYFPGVLAESSPVLGSVTELTDWQDMHMVWLDAGRLVALRAASTQPGADLALSVADSYFDEYPYTYVESDEPGLVEDAVFMPPYSGFYTVAVKSNALGKVATNYSLQWTSALGSGPDDAIPGVALTGQQPVLGNSGEVSGTLDLLNDNSDVYRVVLEDGQKLEAALTFAAGSFSMAAYDDYATSFNADPAAVSFGDEPGVQGLTISQGQWSDKQYYFLRVKSDRGSGSYKLSWRVTPADDELPGLPVAATVNDRLDDFLDRDDYQYWVVKKGQTVRAALKGDAGTNFDLVLYGEDGEPIASSGEQTSTENIVFTADSDRSVSLRVKAQSGSGNYTLTQDTKYETVASLATASASKLSYNKLMTIAGTLKLAGVPVKDKTVTLYKSTNNSSWTSTGLNDVTDADGTYSFTQNVTAKTYYKVLFAGDAEWKRSETSSIYFLPYASLSTPSKPSTAYRNRAFTSTGTLRPGHTSGSTSAVKIECWQYVSGKWVKRKTVSAKLSTISGGSKYTASVSLPYAGTWKLRSYHADSNHSTTYSSYSSTFRVR